MKTLRTLLYLIRFKTNKRPTRYIQHIEALYTYEERMNIPQRIYTSLDKHS